MSDVFISYSKQDKEKAFQLAMSLNNIGLSVWWDRDIPYGQNYQHVIEAELSSAKCVLVLWSTNSVNSNWVKDEANEAIERKTIIPLLIEDVKIPLGFRMIQTGRLVNWNGDTSMPEFINLKRDIEQLTNFKKQEEEIPDKQVEEHFYHQADSQKFQTPDNAYQKDLKKWARQMMPFVVYSNEILAEFNSVELKIDKPGTILTVTKYPILRDGKFIICKSFFKHESNENDIIIEFSKINFFSLRKNGLYISCTSDYFTILPKAYDGNIDLIVEEITELVKNKRINLNPKLLKELQRRY